MNEIKPWVKALALVLSVVAGGLLISHLSELERHDLEAAPLQPGNDLAREPALYPIRLNDHECLLDRRHAPLLNQPQCRRAEIIVPAPIRSATSASRAA